MKIVIDGRLINQTGVGRYMRNLISELGRQDKVNFYVLIVRSEDFQGVVLPNTRWMKRRVDVRWHTLDEQLHMPAVLASEKPDLVHIPYFNIPIFYFGPMIVTIHDLIIDHFDTGKASTLPYWKYLIRRIGYKLVMCIGLHRAKKIIAVSQSTKRELIEHYWLPEEKIVVTYEGVDERLDVRQERIVKEPYFLYVGNAYPHKNVETLLEAFQKVKNAKLVLVGKIDLFYERLQQRVSELGLNDSVIFFGGASDDELINLYDHAIALVCPSLMEGFGLPPLEALARGCPVICSDISVFREILGNSPAYFSPLDVEALQQLLKRVNGAGFHIKDNSLSKKYSWMTMTRETLSIYLSVSE